MNLYGFIDEHIFLTKSGDLGVVLEVRGVDYECLDGTALDALTKRLESAFKLFGDDYRIYQYLFKRNNPPVPHRLYGNPVVDTAIQNRIAYLASKSEKLFCALDLLHRSVRRCPLRPLAWQRACRNSETSRARHWGSCRRGSRRKNRWYCWTANSSELSPHCCKRSAASFCRSLIF